MAAHCRGWHKLWRLSVHLQLLTFVYLNYTFYVSENVLYSVYVCCIFTLNLCRSAFFASSFHLLFSLLVKAWNTVPRVKSATGSHINKIVSGGWVPSYSRVRQVPLQLSQTGPDVDKSSLPHWSDTSGPRRDLSWKSFLTFFFGDIRTSFATQSKSIKRLVAFGRASKFYLSPAHDFFRAVFLIMSDLATYQAEWDLWPLFSQSLYLRTGHNGETHKVVF